MPELMEAWVRALSRSRRAMLGVEGDDKEDPNPQVVVRALRSPAGAAGPPGRRTDDRVRAGAHSRAPADRGDGPGAGAARRDRRARRRPGGEPRAARHHDRRVPAGASRAGTDLSRRDRAPVRRPAAGRAAAVPQGRLRTGQPGADRRRAAGRHRSTTYDHHQAAVRRLRAAVPGLRRTTPPREGDDALAILEKQEPLLTADGVVAGSEGRLPLRRRQVERARSGRPRGRRRAHLRPIACCASREATRRRCRASTRTPISSRAASSRARWPASSPSCARCATRRCRWCVHSTPPPSTAPARPATTDDGPGAGLGRWPGTSSTTRSS